MTRRHVLTALLGLATLCAGCITTQPCSWDPARPEFTKVSVRFVALPGLSQCAVNDESGVETRLAADGCVGGMGNTNCWAETAAGVSSPYHVVLWGGPYYGADVTYATAALPPGPYMFGLFDQDHGVAYQGWIGVNQGGDDVLDTLTEWRNTIREEQQWLGYENKIEGRFHNRNAEDFKRFTKQLRSVRRLERRIDRAIQAEKRARHHDWAWQGELLQNAEVLLMPGTADFFRPSTQPAFRDEELRNVRTGEPLTKVVLVADYAKSMEKLRRVYDLRDDLKHAQAVLVEEVKRLKRQKRYYTITDHLYHHGRRFVENERRLHEALGMIKRIERLRDDQRQRTYALMFTAGMFAPDETFDAFAAEERSLRRERILLEEQTNLVNRRFDATDEDSCRRVSLEWERQNLLAEIEAIDGYLRQLGESRVALNRLRDSTEIIHRHGPARVLTATIFGHDVPVYLADTIERESLMTIRLQTADSLYTPPQMDLAAAPRTDRAVWSR